MSKQIREIMSTDCITVSSEDTIYEAAVKMKQNDIGFIPVVDDGKLVGVCTDRDLVIRGYAEKHSGSTAIKEVMTTDCEHISSETSVDDAAKLMAEKQIRRLCIVDNGQLCGVVAIGDMAIRGIYENEAGSALSEISEPVMTH